VIGCKKQNKTTTSPSSPTTASTTTVALTALDSAMIGDWATDSIVIFYNGTRIGSSNYNDPFNCHLVMHATYKDSYNATHDLWKNSISASNCMAGSGSLWRINTGRLEISNGSPAGILTISFYNSNKLILQEGSITSTGGSAAKYYYHK
jgi:hypothetical protein